MGNLNGAPPEHLLSLAAQGDKQAFGRLYEQYLDEIYRFVLYKIGSQTLAEDITEDTFIKTWLSLPRIYKKNGKIENLRAWLYRTANNQVIDYYRKKHTIETIEEPTQAVHQSPETITDQHVLSEQLTKSIKALEPEFQQIIILRFINQLSHKETATVMDISEGYSRVLQYRALKQLKEIFTEKESENV